MCEYCGAETLSADPVSFCSNCESVVGSESKAVDSLNPALADCLNRIRSSTLKNDFEAASAAYNELAATRPSPQLFYARGIMLIEYSNYVTAQIRYGGDGFTEQNSQLRAKASLLFSEAKGSIAKSLGSSRRELTDAPSTYLLYRLLLCDLKINNLRAARERLEMMEALNSKGIVTAYSKLVLQTYTGMYKEAEKEIAKMLKLRNPPANAFYYAAFNAFKLGDRRVAERILWHSGSLIEDLRKVKLVEALRLEGIQN
jgi:hypothetical protein